MARIPKDEATAYGMSLAYAVTRLLEATKHAAAEAEVIQSEMAAGGFDNAQRSLGEMWLIFNAAEIHRTAAVAALRGLKRIDAPPNDEILPASIPEEV